MTVTHAVLLGLITLTVAVGVWTRAAWIRVVLATVFLCIQLMVLALGLDLHARLALVDEIKARGAAPQGARAVHLVRDAQLQDRLSLALTGMGLFLLAGLGSRSSCAHMESRKPRPPTVQDGAAGS